MKAKHKYILTLSTLALFVISVFIGYFISTAVVTKAPKADEGGCPNIKCSKDEDCPSCDYKIGRCSQGSCIWPKCGVYSGKEDDNANNDCVTGYCCDYYTGNYIGSCFTSIYTSNDKYLCAPK
jgi:hypothetical protein